MKQVDGAVTLAAQWPTALTYMSGDHVNLETEMFIAYDNLAHAIQQALNVTRLSERPQLAVLDYEQEPNACIQDSDLSDNGLPNMAPPFPLFHQKVLHTYDEREEEYRKWHFKLNILI